MTKTTTLRNTQDLLWVSLNQLITQELVQKTLLKNKEFYFSEPDSYDGCLREVVGINIVDSEALVMLKMYDDVDEEYPDDNTYQYSIKDFKFEEVCDLVDALIGQKND